MGIAEALLETTDQTGPSSLDQVAPLTTCLSQIKFEHLWVRQVLASNYFI